MGKSFKSILSVNSDRTSNLCVPLASGYATENSDGFTGATGSELAAVAEVFLLA